MTLGAELRAIAAGRTLTPEAVLAFDRTSFLADDGEVRRDDLVAWVEANSIPAGGSGTEEFTSDAGRAVLEPHVADALVRLADPRRADALRRQADLDQLGADLAAERARREARHAAAQAAPAPPPPVGNPRPQGDADLGPRPGPHPMDPRTADLAQIERDIAAAQRWRAGT